MVWRTAGQVCSRSCCSAKIRVPRASNSAGEELFIRQYHVKAGSELALTVWLDVLGLGAQEYIGVGLVACGEEQDSSCWVGRSGAKALERVGHLHPASKTLESLNHEMTCSLHFSASSLSISASSKETEEKTGLALCRLSAAFISQLCI